MTIFLRRVLLLDAVASGATGLLMAAGAAPLAPLFGLSENLLLGAGLSLLPFAAAVAFMASRARLPRAALVGLVVLNALWVIESVALIAGGFVAATTLGVVFVLAQAAAVGLFAELQWIGLRRAAA